MSQRLHIRFCNLIILTCAVTLIVSAQQQPAQEFPNAGAQPGSHVHISTSAKTIIEPPGLIDGSKYPDRIPDVVAYRLMFLAISEPAGPTQGQSLRQTAKLLPLQLNEKDKGELILVLAMFQNSHSDLERRFNAVAGVNPELPSLSAPTFLSEQKALVQNAQATLLTRMSTEGFQRLHAHIQREKAHMRIVPFPKM